jgi:hypothetical protein
LTPTTIGPLIANAVNVSASQTPATIGPASLNKEEERPYRA